MNSYWVVVCVESGNSFMLNSAYTTPIIEGTAFSPGMACPANAPGETANGIFDNMRVIQMLPAAVGSDGSVGVGVVACDSLGVNPACQNSVSSGTTACGGTGQVSCSLAVNAAQVDPFGFAEVNQLSPTDALVLCASIGGIWAVAYGFRVLTRLLGAGDAASED